jgi:DNA-binding transcriptional regulator YiaG
MTHITLYEINKTNIEKIRKKLKLTQEQFAEKIGVCRETINRWENGHFKPCNLAVRQIEKLIKKYPKKLGKI